VKGSSIELPEGWRKQVLNKSLGDDQFYSTDNTSLVIMELTEILDAESEYKEVLQRFLDVMKGHNDTVNYQFRPT
jgi:hypothetical protein